jgi:hypothetical protein
MSDGEAGYSCELRRSHADVGAEVMRLIGGAVLGAMVEDWTVESLELYRAFEGPGAPRQLPDDTIGRESPLERELVQWLAGEQYPVDGLAASVRDFLSLVVSGSRVLEDKTAFCRVVWVSRGDVAEPVFVLGDAP